MLSIDEMQRYAQQLKLRHFGVEGQLKLKRAKVLCIGAGALGCASLIYLAAAGAGTLGIVDDDVVELSNLPRQILYRTAHVGALKAVVARQELMAVAPNISAIACPERLTIDNAHQLFRQYDVIVDCSDNFETRYLINDTAFALQRPYVFAAVSQFQGHCTTFSGKAPGPCLRCLFPVPPPRADCFSPCGDMGTLGCVPGTLGNVQAMEAIKTILGWPHVLLQQLWAADFLKMQFKKYYYAKAPACPQCHGATI